MQRTGPGSIVVHNTRNLPLQQQQIQQQQQTLQPAPTTEYPTAVGWSNIHMSLPQQHQTTAHLQPLHSEVSRRLVLAKMAVVKARKKVVRRISRIWAIIWRVPIKKYGGKKYWGLHWCEKKHNFFLQFVIFNF